MAYFQDVHNGVVLEFKGGFDISEMKKHAEYFEVDKAVFDAYNESRRGLKVQAAKDRRAAAEAELKAALAELEKDKV